MPLRKELKKCQGLDCNKITEEDFCSPFCLKSVKHSRTENKHKETVKMEHAFGIKSSMSIVKS